MLIRGLSLSRMLIGNLKILPLKLVETISLPIIAPEIVFFSSSVSSGFTVSLNLLTLGS